MDDRIRVSDADRDRVTARLRDHFAEGRLTPDELDERVTAALNARTFGDLRRVMADLPEPAPALRLIVEWDNDQPSFRRAGPYSISYASRDGRSLPLVEEQFLLDLCAYTEAALGSPAAVPSLASDGRKLAG